jgi:hypothetical protein
VHNILHLLRDKPYGVKFEWKRTIIMNLVEMKGDWLVVRDNGRKNF